MNAQLKPDAANVLIKAFTNACVELSVNKTDASRIIGVNPSTLNRNEHKGFDPASKTGELCLQFIRLYRSLFAIAGGDRAFMRHWFTTQNTALSGAPSQLCLTVEGLIRTNEYLDAMRGKI